MTKDSIIKTRNRIIHSLPFNLKENEKVLAKLKYFSGGYHVRIVLKNPDKFTDKMRPIAIKKLKVFYALNLLELKEIQ